MAFKNSPLMIILLSFLCAGAVNLPAEARIVRIGIESTTKLDNPGPAGPYIVVKGRAFGELNPREAPNAIINDIDLAPRNAKGMVEYSTTFTLAKPADISKSSDVLIYDVVNCGRGEVVATPEGHISLVSGWQGDLADNGNLERVTVPAAKYKDGDAITGVMLARFLNMAKGTPSLPLSTGVDSTLVSQVPHPSSTSTTQSALYRQTSDAGPVTKISRVRMGLCGL